MADQVRQTAPIDLRAYHPLARLRWTIRAYVLLEGALLALILAFVWFWFALALDFSVHYFWGIDLLEKAEPVRWVMLAVFAGGIAGVVVWYVMRRLFYDFRPAALALVLEQRFPELLGDRLITAIELIDLERARQQGYSVEMIVQTMIDAKERVERVPVRTVFNWRRLLLMAWSLVGVSVFALLLVYPVVALFSAADQPSGRALAAVLTVNLLLVLSIAFVFFVPCLWAWNRKAGPALRWCLLGMGLLCAVSAAVGYDYAFRRVNPMHSYEYSWRLYHATDISLDRNFRFKDTRWPHDEFFVDWIDFPVDQKRIEFNKTINARAYFTTWIVADAKAEKGWRPLVWSDLAKVVDVQSIPPLSEKTVHDYLIGLTAGDEGSPVGFDRNKMTLPAGADVPVDVVMAMLNDSNAKTVAFTADERDRFALLATVLDARAGDPKLGGRTIRKVNAPEALELKYGPNGRGHSKLAALEGRHNVYELEQPVRLDAAFAVDLPPDASDPSGLTKEKGVPMFVTADVDGRSIATGSRTVVLVRPPKIDKLVYQQFKPAYLYYLPPTAPRADTIDERRQILRGLRQTLAPLQDRPGEVYEFMNVAQGSELTFTATSDKKLTEVVLDPRSADFPGCAGPNDLEGLKLAVTDSRSFTIEFRANGKSLREWRSAARSGPQNPVLPLITKPITFDVVMVDVDNMRSTRSFTVRPIEDKVPNVGLYVDDVRQVQLNGRTVYLCTAKAEIPFAKESLITDDNGLHKVEFVFKYAPLANQAYVNLHAELAGWLWASTPVLPNIGDFLYRREVLLRTVSSAKEQKATEGSARLDAFDNAQGRYIELLGAGKRRLFTVDEIKPLLAKPLPDDYSSPVLKRFEFKESETPIVFDFLRQLPRLGDKDSFGVAPVYEVSLDVRATDSNVLADGPRTSENKEGPATFRIVGESDLQILISREEADLVRRFDDTVKKVEEQQRILQATAVRAASISESTVTSEQTRVEGVMDVVGKARESTAEIANSYRRILREYKLNRFPDKFTRDLESKIVGPLAAVQEKEFPRAENELVQFHVVLKQANPQSAQAQAAPTLARVQELIDALRRIQQEMGQMQGYEKIVQDLKKLEKKQSELSAQELKQIEDKLRKDLLHVRPMLPKSVEVDAGKTTQVKFAVRMPDVNPGDAVMRFEVPVNSGLKIAPTEIRLKDDATEAVFDLTAGAATGTYYIKINPAPGEPVELKVVVK
jgi:hypothetical protein